MEQPQRKIPAAFSFHSVLLPVFQEFSIKNECIIASHPTSLHNCQHLYPPCYGKLANTVTLVHEENHLIPTHPQFPFLANASDSQSFNTELCGSKFQDSIHAHGGRFIVYGTPFYTVVSPVTRASGRNFLILICTPPSHL